MPHIDMKELLDAIMLKHKHGDGIDVYPPATDHQIAVLEGQVGFTLPTDFKTFYRLRNGFYCNEDLFQFKPLSEIPQWQDYFGPGWFWFSEYMIHSDMWGMRLTGEDQYEIFNGSEPELVLTTSLYEFLSRFLQGNVFDAGGLYAWQEEIRAQQNR